MGWLIAYLMALWLISRWWYLRGISEGRLLERVETREERRLRVVPGERRGAT